MRTISFRQSDVISLLDSRELQFPAKYFSNIIHRNSTTELLWVCWNRWTIGIVDMHCRKYHRTWYHTTQNIINIEHNIMISYKHYWKTVELLGKKGVIYIWDRFWILKYLILNFKSLKTLEMPVWFLAG